MKAGYRLAFKQKHKLVPILLYSDTELKNTNSELGTITKTEDETSKLSRCMYILKAKEGKMEKRGKEKKE